MSGEGSQPGASPDNTPPDPSAASSSSEAAPIPFFKRRLPKLILFLGMAGIIIHLFQSQPVLVDLTYEYGRGRRDLLAARVRTMHNGTQTRWVLFDYRRTPRDRVSGTRPGCSRGITPWRWSSPTEASPRWRFTGSGSRARERR